MTVAAVVVVVSGTDVVVVEVVVVDVVDVVGGTVVVVGSGTAMSAPVNPWASASAACRPAPDPAVAASSMGSAVVSETIASVASGVNAANAYTDSSAMATHVANETTRVNLKLSTLRPGSPARQGSVYGQG